MKIMTKLPHNMPGGPPTRPETIVNNPTNTPDFVVSLIATFISFITTKFDSSQRRSCVGNEASIAVI